MRSLGFVLLAILVLWTGYATTRMLQWRRLALRSNEQSREFEREALELFECQTREFEQLIQELDRQAKDAVEIAKEAVAQLMEYKQREGQRHQA